jgi:tetratricopeptide (TPR) repeat protein
MIRWTLLASGLVAALLLACVPPQTTKPMTEDELRAKREQAQQSYSIGQQYFAQGDYEGALRNFNDAIVADSTFYEAYVAVGAVHRRTRDATNAEAYFRKAMAVDPKRPKAYEGLGDLFLSMGSLDQALQTYLDGLAQDSSLVDLYNGAAEVYVRKNEMAKADTLFQTAMRRFPDDQNVQRLWADFLYKQKRYQDAVNALLPVVARFPKVATLRQKLADCYIELKSYDRAVAQLDTILLDNPGDNQTTLRKGVVLMQQGKTSLALTLFQGLVQKDSAQAEYYVYWAEALIQQGNTSSAEAKLRKALALSPGMAQAYADLGDIRLKAADTKRGRDLTATSTANLRAAKSLYEEAKGYYAKAAGDAAFAEYSRTRIEYVDRNVQLVDRELFVRG